MKNRLPYTDKKFRCDSCKKILFSLDPNNSNVVFEVENLKYWREEGIVILRCPKCKTSNKVKPSGLEAIIHLTS